LEGIIIMASIATNLLRRTNGLFNEFLASNGSEAFSFNELIGNVLKQAMPTGFLNKFDTVKDQGLTSWANLLPKPEQTPTPNVKLDGLDITQLQKLIDGLTEKPTPAKKKTTPSLTPA